MPVLAVGLGTALVAVGVLDLVWTTIAASGGGGPLTSRISASLWRQLVPRGADDPDHSRLRLGGLAIVLTVLLQWVALLLVGWTLVFHGAPHAVVDATTKVPASTWERVYFAMFSLSTLGVGDVVPGGDVWRILTGVASGMGLMLATLAISYLVPVLQAVTQRRTLALTVSSLGRNPYEVVIGSMQQDDGRAFALQLISLNASLAQLAQHHLSYPVLHYFHDVTVQAAGAVQLAVLDETMTLFREAIDGDAGPDRRAISSVRHTMQALLDTLAESHIAVDDRSPPIPDLTPLREAGLPVVDDDTFAQRLAGIEERRRKVLAFVEDDGWSWDDVYRSAGEESELDARPDE